MMHPVFGEDVVHSGAMRRDSDAEYKIMEKIIKGLVPGKNGTPGKVALYTEQIPCSPFCRDVIAAFRERYPRIEFEVSHSFTSRSERIARVYEELAKWLPIVPNSSLKSS